MNSTPRSCSVTVKPRKRRPGRDVAAHHAGADDVHVFDVRACSCRPGAFSRSCSRNTRTRLREVGVSEEVGDGARLGLIAELARPRAHRSMMA